MKKSEKIQMTEPQPYKYTTNRRWILGKREPPLRIVKALKFNKGESAITHYVESGPYSITSYESGLVSFKYSPKEKRGNNPPIEKQFNYPVQLVSAACVPGYFLLILSDPNNTLILVNAYGNFKEIPRDPTTSPICLPAFTWVKHQNSMYLVYGTTFGRIECYEISPKSINHRILFDKEPKVPSTTISVLISNSITYLIVSCWQCLLIFKWEDFNNPIELINKIKRSSGQIGQIPSVAAANSNSLAWFNDEELRIFSEKQLISNFPGSLSIPSDELMKIIKCDSLYNHIGKFISQNFSPLAITEHFVIIIATDAILGFSLEDLTLSVRFPFHVSKLRSFDIDPISMNIIATTPKSLFKISYSLEQAPSIIPSISQKKQELISQLKSSDSISVNEIACELLENGKFDSTISILTDRLNDLYHTHTYSDIVSLLCLEYLISELQIIEACHTGDASKFNPPRIPEVEEGYDVYGTLLELLRLRSFQPCDTIIKTLTPPNANEASSSTVQQMVSILLSDGKAMEAIDAIMSLGPNSELLGSTIISAKSQLGVFYVRYDEPKITDLIMAAMPLICDSWKEPESNPAIEDMLFGLLPKVLEGHNSRQLDIIIWAICILSVPGDPKKYGLTTVEDIKKIEQEEKQRQEQEKLRRQKLSDTKLEIRPLQQQKTEHKQIKVYPRTSYTDDEWASHKDIALSQALGIKLPKDRLFNAFATLQHCLDAKLYRTAAMVAMGLELYETAVSTAKIVSSNLAKHFLRSVPKMLQAPICQKLDLTITNEDDDSLQGVQLTKDRVVNELNTMIESLDKLESQADQSFKFLQELEEWRVEQKKPQEKCQYCGGSLKGTTGIAYPCGHAFHEKCAMKAVKEAMPGDEGKELKNCMRTGVKEKIDEVICRDCPACGIRAAALVFSSFIKQEDYDMWDTTLPEQEKSSMSFSAAIGKFTSMPKI